MTATPVEAVWIWYYGGSTQKWTYGRFGASDGFTKDHLQIKASAGEVVTKVYGLAPIDGEKYDVVLHWPGGSSPGSFLRSSGRFTLRWTREQSTQRVPWSAPAPWRMVPDPIPTSPSPLRGDGSATTADTAADAIERFNNTGTRAYLVAVKLRGEDQSLHVRTYIDDPDEELAFASTALLPGPLQAIVSKLGTTATCIGLSVDGAPADPDVAEVIDKLEENPNLLLIGPPGTGKSVLLDKLARHVESPGHGISFNPERIYDAWGELEDSPQPGKAVTVVFHPSYSYDNLVVGLLPKASKGGVSVSVTTGPLVNLAHYATSGGRALLVLDEFNRGNASAILGDTLALLDRDKRGAAHVDLPAYGLPMEVPDEFTLNGANTVGARFTLPPSLWIVAAMNSSDRSVAPLDAALRRRFSIVEMGPDYEILSSQLGVDPSADLDVHWSEWTPGHVASLAVRVLETLNDRIEAALGRDFTLGHSNMWHVGGPTSTEAARSLAAAWDRRIVQTLRLALQDDDDTLAFILKAGKSSEAIGASNGRAVWWRKANSTEEQFARPRLHFTDLTAIDDDEQLIAELKRLAGF